MEYYKYFPNVIISWFIISLILAINSLLMLQRTDNMSVKKWILAINAWFSANSGFVQISVAL